MHGGAAPQVKQAAAERLQAMVDPAMAALEKLLKAESEDVRFRAAKDVLDRTGFKPRERIDMSLQLIKQVGEALDAVV